MPCFHLNAIQRLPFVDLDGNLSRKFLGKARNLDPVKYPLEAMQLVPCRQCIGCRLENSRQWATRILHHLPSHPDACFLTLTYSDDQLPVDDSLSKPHLRTFFNDLRSRLSYYGKGKIQYFAVGEYADPNENTPTGRPHYHAALFGSLGIRSPEIVPDEPSRSGHPQWTHPDISAVWPYGRHTIAELSFESAAYVARYCLKKISGISAPAHYGTRTPEFQSNSNGLGKAHFQKWFSDIYPADHVVLPERGAFLPPAYYDRLLEKADPALFEKVKTARKAEQEKLDIVAYKRLMIERDREGQVRQLVTEATLIRGLSK